MAKRKTKSRTITRYKTRSAPTKRKSSGKRSTGGMFKNAGKDLLASGAFKIVGTEVGKLLGQHAAFSILGVSMTSFVVLFLADKKILPIDGLRDAAYWSIINQATDGILKMAGYSGFSIGPAVKPFGAVASVQRPRTAAETRLLTQNQYLSNSQKRTSAYEMAD